MARKFDNMSPLIEEEQIAPGFFVDRRSVLVGIGGMALGIVPSESVFAAERAANADDTLNFEDFLAQANPLAQDLAGDVSLRGQDCYLRSIAAVASRLQAVPLPASWNFSEQGNTPDSYSIGFSPGGDPFRVLQWRLEPGASCRAHAHTYGNVVTIGLEGIARVRNFEVVGEPDYTFGGTFRVRQTVDQLLGPGSVNLVSLHRNYIHEITAGPDGARGLDITTPLKPKPEYGTPYLSMSNSPAKEFGKTFEAYWSFNS